jgi:hypothetical protein
MVIAFIKEIRDKWMKIGIKHTPQSYIEGTDVLLQWM